MYPQSQSWACSTSISPQRSKSPPITLNLFPSPYPPSFTPTPNYFSSPHSLSSSIFSPKPSSFTTSSNASWVMASENQKGGDDYLIRIEPTKYMVGESSKTRSTHGQMLNLMPMRLGVESSSSNAAKEKLGGDCRTFDAKDRFLLSLTNQVLYDRVPRCYSEVVPNGSQSAPFPVSNELGNHQHRGKESEARALKVIIGKHLTKTDVSSTGRIIIPKEGAERGLPHLNKEEVKTLFMGDLFSGKVWPFKYRFWTNHNSRIYVIERAGPYIRHYRLRKDDLFIVYKDRDYDIYYVAFSKKILQPNRIDDKQDNANKQSQVRGKNEKELQCQICHKSIVQDEARGGLM